MTVDCACGFENPDTAKFCGGCGKALLMARSGCSSCGHVSKPGARFCENCAAPLDVRTPIPSVPPQVQPIEAAVAKKIAKAKPEPPARRIHGTILSLEAGALRVMRSGDAQTVDVMVSAYRLMRIAKLLKVGDEIEVFGRFQNDGTFWALQMMNLKTNVTVLRRSFIEYKFILVACLVVMVLGIAAGPETRGNSLILSVLAAVAVLFDVWIWRSAVRQLRRQA